MKPKSKRFTFLIGLVCLLALCTLWIKSSASQSSNVKVRLLMTKPTVREVQNLLALQSNALFTPPGLKITGIHHEKDKTDTSGVEAFIEKNKIAWFTKETISCDIDEASVFKANGCTESFKKLFDQSDGIFFLGGPDLPPSLYGEKTRLTTKIKNPNRNIFEVSFLHHLLVGNEKIGGKPLLESKKDYVVFAICLGMQSMNVALGGTLIQDIPSQVYDIQTMEEAQVQEPDLRHKDFFGQLSPANKKSTWVLHKIKTKPGKRQALWQAANPDRVVLSSHHQAIDRLGHGLKVLATSTDGKIIEIVGHKKYPNVIGVQFHPEKRLIYRSPLKWHDKRVPYKQHEALLDFMTVLWKDMKKRLVESSSRN